MDKKFCYYCMSAVSADGTCPVCGLTAGTYQPAPHHIPPGTILMNRYLFGRVLGEGGFGITYLACDLRLDLKVAIKEFFPTDKATRHAASSLDVTTYTSAVPDGYENSKRKFLTEARTMAKMEKQVEVVGVRDFFELNNTAYIVMEYVDGTTFRDLVNQEGGKIPTETLLKIIEPLFSALSAMHEAGLVHRDISPDNLMLEKGKVRLLDFGCARESATGTNTLTIALKHGYAPIEQYTNHGQGPWTDIYSLGATIYFCLTGKSPARSTDRMLGDKLLLPSKLGIDLSRAQEKALLHAMAVKPHRRFQTMEEFRAALYTREDELDPPDNDKDDDDDDLKPPNPVDPEPPAPVDPEPPVPVNPEPPAPIDPEPLPKPVTKRRLWLMLGAGVLAVAVCVALVVSHLHSQSDGPQTSPGNGQYYTVASSPVNDTAQPFTLEISEDRLAENYQRFLDALADPEVSEIHVTGTGAMESVEYVETVISKPVYLEENTELICYFPVEIIGDGHLVVDSSFRSEGYLRTQGGGKITMNENAGYHFGGMIWLENSSDLQGVDNRSLHRWEFNEAEAAANAVHVTSSDELAQAMNNSDDNIIIDADMAVSLEFACMGGDRTVIVSPGVAVTYQGDSFNIIDNLLNYGTVILNVDMAYMQQDGHLVNFGTFQVNSKNWGNYMDESAVLNLGKLVIAGGEGFTMDNYLVNMGTIELTDGTLDLGGEGFLLNSGSIAWLSSGENLHNFGTLVNWGSITGSEFSNYAYWLNGGDLNVDYLYNTGLLDECIYEISTEGQTNIKNEDNSRGIHAIHNEEKADVAGGILYLDGPTHIYDGELEHNSVEVTTEQDLIACASGGYDWIIVTEDITCTQNLYLYTNLLIDYGKTLRFTEGTSLYVCGVRVSLSGSLICDNLYFEDGSRLISNGYQEDSMLTGKTLLLRDQSVCYLRYTSVEVENLTLLNESVVLAHMASISCTQECKVDNGSRLMVADGFYGDGVLETPKLTITEGAHFSNLTELELRDTEITLGSSYIDNMRPLSLWHSNITVSENSSVWTCRTVKVRTNSSLVNNGEFWADRELELYCDTVNNGMMRANSLKLSGSFQNNGEVQLWELIDYDNVFSGNEPIYTD